MASTSLPTVRVAAIQATPVILDGDATLEKALNLLHQAADQGVQVAVLPECFFSVFPSSSWARTAADFGDSYNSLWERMWASSVDVPGPMVEGLVAVCAEREMYCAVGVNERVSSRPGTIYNTMLVLGPGGLLLRHRKLMPTHQERLFHGVGAGDDLKVVGTPIGRVGGLICWENRMPLARYAIEQLGAQIWLAPTADDSDGWQATARHIAIEAGAFVVSVPQYIPRSAFPDDFPVPLPDQEIIGRGGAVIAAPPWGTVVAGPLFDQEGTVIADCDLSACLHAKRWFDAAGHYSREEILLPLLNNQVAGSNRIDER